MDHLLLSLAMLNALRMLTLITGTLVLIDSIGIIVSPIESPPHSPKWSALSWCVIATTAAGVTGYLVVTNSPPTALLNPVMYLGLTVGFTFRAVSRAQRPWLTIIAVVGLSIAGVIFALKDLNG